jgi:hypothetical protein
MERGEKKLKMPIEDLPSFQNLLVLDYISKDSNLKLSKE